MSMFGMLRDEQEHIIRTASRDALEHALTAHNIGSNNGRANKPRLVTLAINALDSREREPFMRTLQEEIETGKARKTITRFRGR